MHSNVIISIGSFNAALSITLSAFAAHALKQQLNPADLLVFKTACEFHFWHSLGLIAIGLIAQKQNTGTYSRIAGLMIIGILLFSGSLYALSTIHLRWIGWITPFGGLSFIIAWTWLAWVTLKNPQG